MLAQGRGRGAVSQKPELIRQHFSHGNGSFGNVKRKCWLAQGSSGRRVTPSTRDTFFVYKRELRKTLKGNTAMARSLLTGR